MTIRIVDVSLEESVFRRWLNGQTPRQAIKSIKEQFGVDFTFEEMRQIFAKFSQRY